jgi:hypothetical protein
MWSTCRLGLLVMALGMVVAWEVLHAPISGLPASAAVTPQLRVSTKQRDAASAALRAQRVEYMARSILARPLFAPSRRPNAAVAATAIAPVGASSLPRLTGVIIAPSARLALFAPVEGKIMTAMVGTIVEGYEVRSISLDDVILAGPDGEHELRTRFVHVLPHVIHARQEALAQ